MRENICGETSDHYSSHPEKMYIFTVNFFFTQRLFHNFQFIEIHFQVGNMQDILTLF